MNLSHLTPSSPFALRLDHQATREGVAGGLPYQEAEWVALSALTWDEAKAEARAMVKRIPLCRWDKTAAQHLSGCVLVEMVKTGTLRTLAFTFHL
jgi:hypothetical protein